MKKWIVLLCSLMALLLLLCACKRNDAGEEETSESVETEAPVADETPTEGEDEQPTVAYTPVKMTDFTLVYPKVLTTWGNDMLTNLTEALNAKAGGEIVAERDGRTKGEEAAARYEIIVGNTTRQESQDALAKLDYNEYGIFVSEKKIVIVGWTDYTCRLATEDFKSKLREYVVTGDDGVTYFDFKETTQVVTAYKDYYGDLPAFDGTVKGVYDGNDKCYTIWYEATDATAFTTYENTVKAAGYTIAPNTEVNTIGDNSYATYVKDGKKIHFYYVAVEKELRVTYGPDDLIPELMQAKSSAPAGTVTPQVTLMPMRYISAAGGGACMIYTLEDGTFFVIDGGWKEEAEVLYNTLKALNTDANGADAPIVISAWFISHGHGDHIGCIYEFAGKYAKQVTVNSLIYNGVHDTQVCTTRVTTDDALSPGKVQVGLLSLLKNSEGGAPKVMKLHSGQKLRFGGAEIDVMFTHEDLFDTKISNFNDFNTILRLKLGGETMMLANDATSKELPELIKEVGAADLKAEFIMVTHHGADSGYKEYYETVEAKYYFWPNSYDHFIRDTETLAERQPWAPYARNNATELYLAWDVCTTLNLPYTEGSFIEWAWEDERPSQKVIRQAVNTSASYGESVAWSSGVKEDEDE